MTTTEILEKLMRGDLNDPTQLSNFLVVLCSKLITSSNCVTEAEVLKNKKWLELKGILKSDGKEKTDKFVDIEITQTDEWLNWKRLSNADETMRETIMALKKKVSAVNY